MLILSHVWTPYTKPQSMGFRAFLLWLKRALALAEWQQPSSPSMRLLRWSRRGFKFSSPGIHSGNQCSSWQTRALRNWRQLVQSTQLASGISVISTEARHLRGGWTEQQMELYQPQEIWCLTPWNVLHMQPLVRITIMSTIHLWVIRPYVKYTSYKHMINVYTIDYVPSDERFQAILAEIKAQPWYIYIHTPNCWNVCRMSG